MGQRAMAKPLNLGGQERKVKNKNIQFSPTQASQVQVTASKQAKQAEQAKQAKPAKSAEQRKAKQSMQVKKT